MTDQGDHHHDHAGHGHAHPAPRRVGHQARAFSVAQVGIGVRLGFVVGLVALIWLTLYFLVR